MEKRITRIEWIVDGFHSFCFTKNPSIIHLIRVIRFPIVQQEVSFALQNADNCKVF